ncbi:putative DNA mimic protein [Klebsiella phage KPPK108.1]|uniref:DNA mimic protein n=1 Tax=Klebsiella phage KPPK108.1 TaxID=2894584 RepID=A0AAE9C7K1_9CAUD|nr:putative DNA mimic protein [Klebsiella phage KPPK108.1]
MKMQETNTTPIEWKVVAPEGANALPMKESMYSSGDYWTPFQDLQMQGSDHPHTEGPLQALMGLRTVSMLTPGLEVTIGGALHPKYHEVMWIIGPLQRVDLYNSGTFCELFAPAARAIDSKFWERRRDFYDGDDVVVERAVASVEEFTGYKVHKQAVQLFERIMLAPEEQQRRLYTGYDYGRHLRDGNAAALLMKLHGFVVSRFAVPLGFGFRNGEPIVMLGQPRMHKDFAAVTEYRCVEMRVGKWLANYYGNGVDFRNAIEDLKAMNVEPTTYLCKTEQEWYDAYENGPGSCMSGYSFEHSPVRAYATTCHGLPDNGLRLFIQYTGELFGDDFEVQARAIVKPKTKEYVRAYGNAADAILRGHGYTRNTGCLEGVLLARIPHPTYTGAVLMPYLDSDQCGVDEYDDGAFVIRDAYEYTAQDADGYIYVGTEFARCCCCEWRYSVEDMHETADDEMVCDGCVEEGEFVYVVGREGLHNRWSSTWSDYHDAYVYDADIEYCAVEGVVHDSEELVFAQDWQVLIEHAEEHPVHGLILTEYAADCLGERYLGNDDEEEVEEAA